MSKETRFITRTAMLLALTIVLQYLGRFIPAGINSNFIVGPLVNACLIIATGLIGFWAGIIISFASAFFAAISTPVGSMFLLPTGYFLFIGLGNAVLVLFYALFKKKNEYIGLGAGVIAKFIVIFGSLKLYLDVFKITGSIPEPKLSAITNSLLFAFGWPQLITAIIGSVIAIIILKRLKTI